MKVIVLLLVTFELCWTIRVPVTWNEGESDATRNSESDVIRNSESDEEFSVESFKPQDFSEGSFELRGDDSDGKSKPQDSSELHKYQNDKPIPVEYFQYTAKKPQFAVDVAAFHGVQSPENHYKAYPIRPHNGIVKQNLGKHRIFDSSNTLHRPFQDYTAVNDNVNHANPVSSSYDVFHPYEAETPALQEIYKDPVLSKIRNDLEFSKNRLQQYEKDAGEANISKEEYMESPLKTDDKLFPRIHRPAPFEIHRPHRRPVYYRPGPPVYKSREQYLNQKLRHPWNHNTAKVRPMHYRPLQNHIFHLRQNHALKYDDERNEYPQEQMLENYSDPQDGYDIYERGKEKFVHLRHNVDESINNAVKENRPPSYEKLEVQNNDSSSDDDDEDGEEFIPVKNYAQVRKTESFRHLPRIAALEEAASYDEIKNSPRLREAVKSTKAQTVYSEEGYEDTAYDHAGEQKHASENEGHGGFLKEKEFSGGKYKTPSVSANYEDGSGSISKNQLVHAEKWKDDNKDTKEELDSKDYAEDEHEHLLEADNYQTEPQNEDNDDHRKKRENKVRSETLSGSNIFGNESEHKIVQHELDKREAKFEVPQINLNSTFFKDSEFLKIAKLKMTPKKESIRQKYPYYFKYLTTINKNSPLRYAENLKFIPKKSKGGTEFYDSRSKFECPEVDDVPDPVPEKLKSDGHPDGDDDSSEKLSSSKGEENFDTTKKQPRLKGLGDKIDCFKAKYFGENPLDSPFFKEDIISKPEPIFLQNIAAYKLKAPNMQREENVDGSESNVVIEKLQENKTSDLYGLLKNLKNDQDNLQSFIPNFNKEFVSTLNDQNNISNLNSSELADQSNVYDDVIENIKASLLNVTTPQNKIYNHPNTSSFLIPSEPNENQNISYIHFQSKEDITKSPLSRKKRATLFVYEPYKIIREMQDDTKKTTVSSNISNISPLIKQLQTSKMLDPVNKFGHIDTLHVKRNVKTRPYKDIGQKDRESKVKYGASKNDKGFENSEIIDVSINTRRGEPRYEIKHGNHKLKYTPVTNRKSMTAKDFEAQVDSKSTNIKSESDTITIEPKRQKRPTEKSNFDKLRLSLDVKNTTSPYTLTDTISTTIRPHGPPDYEEHVDDSENEEDYEDYDEDQTEEDEIKIISLITSTTTRKTPKLDQQRMFRPKTTTPEPRLKLVTRFRDYRPPNHNEDLNQKQDDINIHKTTSHKPLEKHHDIITPTFREKKKKISKSTLVTDSKSYGDAVEGDDKNMKDEVDALIGVRQNMNEYMPSYENEKEHVEKETSNEGKSNESADYDDDDNDEDDEDDDDEFDYEDEDDDDEDSNESEEENASHTSDANTKTTLKFTTPEPTKRTLVITTDAPVPTIASRSAKLQVKPIVTRKIIEIHNELPINNSSPHITQFKQDIKEIEVVKETRNPLRRKPNKNVEVLDLYKDDNLAKDINKLGVEIFKENLDLRQGPKHGGNYRSADTSTIETHKLPQQHSKNDTEASQSEYKKHIDANSSKYVNSSKDRNFRNGDRNVKSTESVNNPDKSLYGGHMKYSGSRNNNAKSQKLIELAEDDDDSSSDSIETKSYSDSTRPMHGGNYRSAQLRGKKAQTNTESPSKDTRRNAALILSSFVQAAPVLTTNSGFILDPSKRKYYYVDA